MGSTHIQSTVGTGNHRHGRTGPGVHVAQNVDGAAVFPHGIHCPARPHRLPPLGPGGPSRTITHPQIARRISQSRPAYLTETGIPYEDTLKSAQRAVDEGYKGFKDHSMLGVETNLALAKDIRDLVGDDMVLMHDPVQQYSVEDAIAVGRGLEELNYLWIEEPLQEFDINGLKRLSDAIDLPVMALESIQGNPYLAAPYLSIGAIDIVRQTGLGITGQMKLANLAEMFGLNCHGGNPHVVAAVRNDDWWEVSAWPPTGADRSLASAFAGLIEETTEVRDGYMYVPQTPGLGRKIDWDRIEAQTVMEI